MSAHWVPLTANNIQLCAPLWGDRHTYSPQELARALAVTGELLHRRRALGAAVFEDAVVRGFGISVFVDEGWIAAVLAEGRPQIAKRLLRAINPRDEKRSDSRPPQDR